MSFDGITLTGLEVDNQVQGLDRKGVPVWIKVKDVAEALSELYPRRQNLSHSEELPLTQSVN